MKLTKLKLYGAMAMLSLGLAAGPQGLVYAEDQVVYEETDDDYIEEEAGTYTEEEIAEENKVEEKEDKKKKKKKHDGCMDKDNTKLKPGEGEEIPDYVLTEAERKGINKDTPDPTPVPKTDAKNDDSWILNIIKILAGIAAAYVGFDFVANKVDDIKDKTKRR